jgi:rubrerythrin
LLKIERGVGMDIFNAAEVVDMGIEKEKKRRDFYGLVADTFLDPEMKNLFNKLKNWEETHIKKFSEIRANLKQQEPAESYPGELEAYMEALLDDKLYKEVTPSEFSKNVTSKLNAIMYGISFEKDAILFFNELLPYISVSNKAVVQELINEEKQHIVYLAGLKKKLQA